MGKNKGLSDRLDPEVVAHFPNLKTENYQVTSPKDTRYNCIAHAAGDARRWWAPVAGYYWPEDAERGMNIDALQSCYESVGYELCDDGDPEGGYTKVALYADTDGAWTHAARQTDGGEWTSKLGRAADIRHRTPDCIGGATYGEVAIFMRRVASREES